MDSSLYTAQQSAPTQTQYNPNLYMQHVYSPQQQYPLYGIVPQTWTTSPTPYFETPLVSIVDFILLNGVINNIENIWWDAERYKLILVNCVNNNFIHLYRLVLLMSSHVQEKSFTMKKYFIKLLLVQHWSV